MASHLASLWKWDFLQLGNGLLRVLLYGGVKEAPNVSLEYQATDQIPSFYVALDLSDSWAVELPPSTNAN